MPTHLNTARPVIYLDSSDFSNLSSPDKHDWKAHRSRLLEVAGAGLAEFRFSAVHVMELTHVSPEAKRWSIGRARTVKELCCGHCLLFWNDLVLAEGVALVQGRVLRRDQVYREDGRWTPEIDVAVRELRDAVQREVRAGARRRDTQLRDAGTPGHVRKARRRGSKGGRNHPELIAPSDTDQARADLGAALEAVGLPGDSAMVDLVRRMLAGNLPPSEVHRTCVAMVTDLPSFVGRHYDMYHDLARFFGSLRHAGASLREGETTIRDAVSKMASLRGADAAKAWLQRTIRENPFIDARRSMLTLVGRQQRDALRRHGISQREWESSVVRSEWGRVPAVDTMLGATLAHVGRHAPPGARSKLLDSSFADFLHLCYLPYVDVLRCDAETAQVASPLARQFGTRVAASFEDVLRLFDEAPRIPGPEAPMGTKLGEDL